MERYGLILEVLKGKTTYGDCIAMDVVKKMDMVEMMGCVVQDWLAYLLTFPSKAKTYSVPMSKLRNSHWMAKFVISEGTIPYGVYYIVIVLIPSLSYMIILTYDAGNIIDATSSPFLILLPMQRNWKIFAILECNHEVIGRWTIS